MNNAGQIRLILQAIEIAAHIANEYGSHTQKSMVLSGVEALAQIAGDLLTRDLIQMVTPARESQAS